MKTNGRLFLIPSPISDGDPSEVIPKRVLDLLPSIRRYVVEEVRTARRFLSAAGLKGSIGELEFTPLNEHTPKESVERMLELFSAPDGSPVDVGLVSEAGLPAVADPGAALVDLCQRSGVKVIPMVGPSSLMLALMASGLNGQSFAFLGYLPAKTDQRRKSIKEIERLSRQMGQTQIFIETPYRNESLMSDLLSVLQPSTRLCYAAGITTPDETIITRTVSQWRSAAPPVIGKRPCVFLLLANND